MLVVMMNGRRVGQVTRANGRLQFRYDAEYLESGPGIPLSLSMPLVEAVHGHGRVHPFLWGLLPDNEQILRRWAARFQTSATSAFGLLSHVGEDCAGAVQFFPAERFEPTEDGRQSLSEDDVAAILRDLRRDPGLTRRPGDVGQFSLAGAQAKTALQLSRGRWYLPSGREPTTHILKPPRPDLDGHVENEHFCLRLAAAAGLRVARTRIQWFGDERAIVVERYDRKRDRDRLHRVHQEDACQALAVHPANKYESEGGPGIDTLMGLLNQSSRPVEDRRRFMNAVAFNYVVLGTDAHAKNFSLLLGDGGQVRLAPLYDLASLLPYPRRRRAETFAMRIDRHYRDSSIQPRHFETMARRCTYPVDDFLGEIVRLTGELPHHATRLLAELRRDGIESDVLGELVSGVEERCASLTRKFGA